MCEYMLCTTCTAAALMIEALVSIICRRSKPEIAERAQVLSEQMIDQRASIINAATVPNNCSLPPKLRKESNGLNGDRFQSAL
jgi:hypothetical protein